MDNIKGYIDLLGRAEPQDAGMDACHYLQIVGSLIAKKPDRVLEVGIGTALLTVGLIMGLRYNRCGTLTCVDNWGDWHGAEPPDIESLREAGVTVIAPVEELQFLRDCPDNAYDFIISDGDHRNSGSWVDEYFRITKPDGFMYFHDTNNYGTFPSLALIMTRVKELQLPYYHFTQSSRVDERCERGLLFVINKK
jgi:predicted O-methyltransferase YrrM